MPIDLPRVHAAELRAWSAQPPSVQDCACGLARRTGWDSITDAQWPECLDRVATLRDPDLDEPTFAEHHPAGTRYESHDAPVVPAFFPYNRCEVYRCRACGRHALRYTEYGGYYVEHRVRCLQGRPVIDARPEGP